MRNLSQEYLQAKMKFLLSYLAFEFNTKVSRCSICSDEFASARELNQHQKETDHGYSLACKASIFSTSSYSSILYASFINATLNVKGKRGQSPKSYFSCQVCDKKFKTKYTLRSHEKVVHSDNMPFKCSKCDNRFKDQVI